MSFIIYSLPRSRTAWVAHYLSYPLARPLLPVEHNQAALLGSVDAFISMYKDNKIFGAVEINAVPAWRIIRKELPDLKTILIRRPLLEVMRSFAMADRTDGNIGDLAAMDAMLDLIATQPGVMSIEYRALETPVMCKWLFEHCLEIEADFDWYVNVAQLHIQINREEELALRPKMQSKLDAFRADVLERMKGIETCLH